MRNNGAEEAFSMDQMWPDFEGYGVFEGDRGDELETLRMQVAESNRRASLARMSEEIAHEMNNPLAVVRASSERLQALLRRDPIDKGEICELAGFIECTTERMATIVKMLSFSNSHRVKRNWSCISIRNIVDQVRQISWRQLGASGVRLFTDRVEKDLYIDGNSLQMSQVLTNLLNNALEASAQSEMSWVSIRAQEWKPHWVEVVVVDNGHGLPEDALEKLFTPFFSTKKEGAGMGLSICADIIECHGGEVFCEPRHRGARVGFRLPQSGKGV